MFALPRYMLVNNVSLLFQYLKVFTLLLNWINTNIFPLFITVIGLKHILNGFRYVLKQNKDDFSIKNTTFLSIIAIYNNEI